MNCGSISLIWLQPTRLTCGSARHLITERSQIQEGEPRILLGKGQVELHVAIVASNQTKETCETFSFSQQ